MWKVRTILWPALSVGTCLFQAALWGNGTIARGAESLAGVSARIARQEKAVRSIEIWAKFKLRSVIAGKGTRLRPLESAEFRALFDGLPAGRCRFDVRRMLSIWFNGPAPFEEEAFSVAYNGRAGTQLKTLEGPFTKPFAVLHGRIYGHAPPNVAIFRFYAGWTATVFGFPVHLYQQRPLSILLATPPKGWRISATSLSRGGGRHLCRLTIKMPIGTHVLLLDPDRSYAIESDEFYPWTGRRTVSGQPVISRRPFDGVVIHGFWEPVPGVFYPKQVKAWTCSRVSIPNPDSVFTLRVTRVRVNVRGVNPNSFIVHFPLGTTVADQSTGKVIQVGGTVEQQMQAIEKAVTAARKEVSTQPAQKGGGK